MEKRRGRRREGDKACACWICSTSLFLYFSDRPPPFCLSPVIQSLVIKMLPLDTLFCLQWQENNYVRPFELPEVSRQSPEFR